MAIALDVASGDSFSSTTEETIPITVASNSNRRLLVAVAINGDFNTHLSGITYNGTAMTQLVELSSGVNDNGVELWDLVAPDTGTHNLVVTVDGTADFLDVGWVSLYNTDQNTIDATNSGIETSSQDADATVTSTVDNCWAVSIGYPRNNPSQGITGATIFNDQFFSDAGYSGPHSPDGTITHTYEGQSSGEYWIWAMASVAPFVAATTAIKDIIGGGVIPVPR